MLTVDQTWFGRGGISTLHPRCNHHGGSDVGGAALERGKGVDPAWMHRGPVVEPRMFGQVNVVDCMPVTL